MLKMKAKNEKKKKKSIHTCKQTIWIRQKLQNVTELNLSFTLEAIIDVVEAVKTKFKLTRGEWEQWSDFWLAAYNLCLCLRLAKT